MEWKNALIENINDNIEAANQGEIRMNNTLINLAVFLITFVGPISPLNSLRLFSSSQEVLLFLALVFLLFSIGSGLWQQVIIREFHRKEAKRMITLIKAGKKEEILEEMNSSPNLQGILQLTFFIIGITLIFAIITILLFFT